MEKDYENKNAVKELYPVGKVEEARNTLEVLKIIKDYYGDKDNQDRIKYNKFHFKIIRESLNNLYRNYLPNDLKNSASELLSFFKRKSNSSIIKQYYKI